MKTWTLADLERKTDFPNFTLPAPSRCEGRVWRRRIDDRWELNVGGFPFLDGVDADACCRWLGSFDAEPVGEGAALEASRGA